MRAVRRGASLALAGALAGCSLFHHGGPPRGSDDPVVIGATQRLQALRGNTDLASRVPDAITDAQTALDAASSPHGSAEHATNLAFIADTRVKVAEIEAKASRNEEEYKSLSAKLEAREGGSGAVSNLAPLMPASRLGLPNGGENPPTPDVSTALAPSDDLGLPPSSTGSQGWGSLGVDLPAPGQATPAAPSGPPPLPPLPTAAGSPHGPGESGTLLWLPGTEFTRDHTLSGYGRQAVHALLPSLSRNPARTLGIFSATGANIDAVRRELGALGIPEQRMRQASASDVSGVEVDWQ